MLKVFVSKRLNLSSADFLLVKDQKFSESDLLFFRDKVKRLESGEPFQHVSGEVFFYNQMLKCDYRALIPRPETEELVDWIVKEANAKKVIDFCAGSGCIGLALKSEISNLSVQSIELSDDAIELIKENEAFTGISINPLKFDVLNDNFKNLNLKADVWVSNPPYIPNKDKEIMESNVLDFEPGMALFVDDSEPLVFYEKIAQEASTLLIDGGFLFFEIHEDLGEEVVAIMNELGFVNIELRKDLQGKDRMVKGQKVLSRYGSE
ncbi:MAG: peptide chain release factor N(5)-glutamine methyltransferase [Crocinitomicaceae bacterium]|nr:peptide chain release factor N(5)-glutamine methyltransferase [Crocinitomicaceae bacterium]